MECVKVKALSSSPSTGKKKKEKPWRGLILILVLRSMATLAFINILAATYAQMK
jgi:hypothetical protein